MPTREGIDVSHYQNEAGGGGASAIKWTRVGNAGVKFTFVKISDKTSKDAFAVRNVADAKAAGASGCGCVSRSDEKTVCCV